MSAYTMITSGVAPGVPSAGGNSLTTTVIANIGDLVVVRYVCAAAARPSTITCVDNVGGTTNVWSIAIDGGNGTASYTCIFWCVLTSTIPSGSLITVSVSPSQASQGLEAFKCSNPYTSTPLDPGKTAAASGSSTSPATASLTPSTIDWVAVGVINYNGGTSVAPAGGWTEDNDNSSVGLESQTMIGTSLGAITPGGTLTPTGPWHMSAAIFRLGAGSSVVTLNQQFTRHVAPMTSPGFGR